MTCVIGIKQEERGRVLVAGDTCLVAGYAICPCEKNKVLKQNGIVLGWGGNIRSFQVIENNLIFPRLDEYSPDTYAFTVAEMIGDLLHEHHCAKEDSNERSSDNEFILAFGANLYTIGYDYSATKIDAQFDAIGSGSAVAIGALEAIFKLDPFAKIKTASILALEIASKYSTGVRAPYTALWTNPTE